MRNTLSNRSAVQTDCTTDFWERRHDPLFFCMECLPQSNFVCCLSTICFRLWFVVSVSCFCFFLLPYLARGGILTMAEKRMDLQPSDHWIFPDDPIWVFSHGHCVTARHLDCISQRCTLKQAAIRGSSQTSNIVRFFPPAVNPSNSWLHQQQQWRRDR